MSCVNNSTFTALLISVVCFIGLLPCIDAATVDVALNKPIKADITCGRDRPEDYYDHDQEFISERQRVTKYCNNATVHPPEAMVDGNAGTWWQSTSRINLVRNGYGITSTTPQSVIKIDLQQTFEAQRITISMGNSKRPSTVILSKSTDGVTYTGWIYRVTDANDCNLIWRLPMLNTPRNMNSKICQAYGTTMQNKDEDVIFDLSGVGNTLAAWRNLRYLEIAFYNMDLTLGPRGTKFQHYTVKNLEILAECTCNGHQTDCVQSNVTKQYECVCGDNTEGRYCERCKPFYNQKGFSYDKPCEICYCYQHSNSCRYDATVDNFNMSINANLVRDGGGVCIDCQHNTTGNNCDKCLPFHYRPIGVSQTQPNPCVPCDCHGSGVRVNLETGLTGDCVMNNDTLVPQGMNPGDCYCKSNVTGPNCDTCKPGFFNLQATNPTGCQDCLCDTRGTVGGTYICETNVTGQCPCKTHVINRQCNECRDGYYGLNETKVNGCDPCECDVGASRNNVCNKVSGQCPCRNNILQRQCKDPAVGFYYPKLHFIHKECEDLNKRWGRTGTAYEGWGYAIVTSNTPVSTALVPPAGNTFSDMYQILVRYRTPSVNSVTGTVVIVGNTGSFTEPVTFINSPTGFTQLVVGQAQQKTYRLNKGSSYTITVSAGAEVYLDRIVALPVEFTNTTALFGPTESVTFSSKCPVFQNDMRVGTSDEQYCLAKAFSLTTRYLDGALPCNCHAVGAYNNTCDPYGGQCFCKPGVTGRRCDECALEYWNLTPNGCQYCNCSTVNKVCDRNTGQCLCPPNIEGRQCDRCKVNHWNFNNTLGCEPCNCNPTGALSLQCNATSGVCLCKSGVNGFKCNECQDDYKAFSAQGCIPCGCDEYGSVNNTCDKVSGQCPCKKNTMGMTCVMCKAGTFYNYKTHEDGCLDCVCMGITRSCGSTTWRNRDVELPLQNATSPYLTVTTPTQTQLLPIRMEQRYGLTLARVVLGSGADVYWLHPFELKGNLLGIYGNTVSWTVLYDATDTSGQPTQPKIIIYGRNNTRIDLTVPQVQRNASTDISIAIQVENVVPTMNITRGKFMEALTDVQMFLIPASYYTFEHDTGVANWKYSVANPTGVGPRALGVEKCNCGVGYSGQSCELCSAGYKRFNATGHPYLGTCVPCQCNNHASFCNEDTGVCDTCLHNTRGDNCELCNVGYYGDPTRGTALDCQVCPCYQPRVMNSTCELVTGRPVCTYCREGYAGDLCNQCDPFYYGNPALPGGSCTRCECNNNAVTCNPVNGACLNCANNSTGFNCERCIDGFFGNATIQGCTPCECNMTGSNSSICEHGLGQCPCKPGVGDRICDKCLPNFYGYQNTSIFGCADCKCNAFGSANLQCDESGVCTCQANVNGAKCDKCNDGFFGLPGSACQSCDCNQIGTANLTKPCDVLTGQCDCKPGVTGRQCDQCQRLYTDFGPTGCRKCDDCEFSLGNDTQRMKDEWEGYWNYTTHIRDLQTQDTILQQISAKINSTSLTLGVSEGTLDTLTLSVQNLTSREASYNDSVANLLARVVTVGDAAGKLENNSIVDVGRQREMLSQAQNAKVNADTLTRTCPAIISKMETYNTSSFTLLKLGDNAYTGLNYTFDKERQQVSAEVATIQDITTRVDSMRIQVQQQSNRTGDLEAISQQQNSAFGNLTAEATQVTNLLNTVMRISNGVLNQLNGTLYNKHRAEALFAEASSILSVTEGILTGTTLQNYNDAFKMFQNVVQIINGGYTGSLNTVANTTVDLTGITSWNQGSTLAETMINATTSLLASTSASVSNAEAQATNLTTQAQALKTEYDRVAPRGQNAVDAITNYENVIKTLDESLIAAQEANKTMGEALTALNTISIGELENDANLTRASIEALSQLASAWNATPGMWNPRIDAANTSLRNAVSQWETISQRILNYNVDVANVSQIANNSPIQAELNQGNIAADKALNVAQTNIANDNILRNSVEREARNVASLSERARNASLLQTDITNRIETFKRKLNNEVQSYIDLSDRDYNQSAPLRSSIDAKIIELEAKVKRARELLASLEQPVSFRGGNHESISNPDVGRVQQYSSIQFEFSYERIGSGVLVFVENNQTSEKLLVQLVNNQVVYEYSNVDSTMKATSKAVLQAGTWYKVVATRYDIDGQLTVTVKSTGGTAVEHMRGESTTHGRLTLNSDVYVGGLPSTYQTSKVTPTNRDFVGCVYQLQFNGITLPLWQTLLRTDSSAACCKKPPEIPPPATVSALTFKGLTSYLKLNNGAMTIGEEGQVSFQFRTYSPEGVIYLADKDGTRAYVGLFIMNGELSFHVITTAQAGEVQLVPKTDSSRKRRAPVLVNDGEWRQVTAMFNRTYAVVTLAYVNQTISNQTFVDSANNLNLNTTSLVGARVTVGAQNPTDGSLNRGPTVRKFAGSIRDFQRSVPPTLTLQDLYLNAAVNKSVRVDLNAGYETILNGLGIDDPAGYARLRQIPASVDQIDFEFQSFQPNGILLYALISADPAGGATGQPIQTFLYIGLFNGNLFLIYNQGLGVPGPLRTRGLYLSDGKKHTVQLNFLHRNSPRLTVNGKTHYGALTMNIHMAIKDNSVYVGGVPPAISLDNRDLPYKGALQGCISNLQINNQAINFFNIGVLSPGSQKGVFLSGCPAPPDVLPPLPYTTTPAPPTTPPPTCAPPPDFNGTSIGMRYGDETVSYNAYNLTGNLAVFENAFSLQITFQALQENGILAYIATSNAPNPSNYFLVYLNKGKIAVDMRTSNSSGTFQIPGVVTRMTYNDGNFHTAEVLRVNDFIAVVDFARKDYANNNGKSNFLSNLRIGTHMYIGGIPPSITGLPFTALSIGRTSFHGCISEVKAVTHRYITVDFNGPGLESVGVGSCIANAIPGVYFNGSMNTAYARIMGPQNTFTLSTATSNTFNMTFRTFERNGTLISSYIDATHYVVLGLYNGELRAVLANGRDGNAPFMVVSEHMRNPFDVCSNEERTVAFTINGNGITLQVDNFSPERFALPSGFLFSSMPVAVVYAGGFKNPAVSVPKNVATTESLRGCIVSLKVNNANYMLSTSNDKNAVSSGCPS